MKTSQMSDTPHTLPQTVNATTTCLIASVLILLTSVSVQAGNNALQHQLSLVESGTLVIAPQDASQEFHSQPPVSTDVNIDISGLLARANVKQTFRNNTDHRIEAIYAFPLPDESRVDRLEMQIGKRTIEGEIRGKQQARKEYTQALRDGKRVSLLESHRPNLFTNRVANIPAGETIQITFSYQWQVDYDDGVFGLRVPLTITPRYMPGDRLSAAEHALEQSTRTLNIATDDQPISSSLSSGADLVHSVTNTLRATDASGLPLNRIETRNATPTSIFITINTEVPLESVSSPSHKIHTDQTDSQWRVSLANGMVPTDRDFTLSWSPLLGRSPLAAAYTQSFESEPATKSDSEHFASIMVMPPQDLYQSSHAEREVIFVIDTSGSMQGNSIRQARAALLFAIDRLTENDTFNVIEFNSLTRTLFDTARSASAADKATATNWVRSLRADGGTEIGAALNASLGSQSNESNPKRLRQVVFITDGSVGNEAELYLQIKNTLGPSRLFTVGIGSAPNTWFMRRAAETGRGTYTYIAKQDQVQEKMRLLLQRLEKPVLTGISLQWSDIDNPEVYPAVIPDLYAGEPVLFDARWQGDTAAGTLLIQGMHNGNKWSSQLQLDTQNKKPDSVHATSLEKQWAHRKIESMENSLLFNEDRTFIEQQITDLALHYAMVTRYTSLIAVDQQITRDPDSNQSVRTAAGSAMPHHNTMLLPQGSLGISLRLLLAGLFSVAAVLFGLATTRQASTA